MVAILIVAVILFIVVLRHIKVVPADSAYVVERLGRYQATLPPGLHVLVPFVDRIAHRYSLAPMDEELTESAISLDNVPVSVTLAIRWQIVDAERAAYASASVIEFVKGIVRTALREAVGRTNYDELRESTREIQSAIVRVPAGQAGVKVVAAEVKKIGRAS